MSKRHTPSRTFIPGPKMIFLLVKESKYAIGEWIKMPLEDAKVLAQVLHLEGKETAILG